MPSKNENQCAPRMADGGEVPVVGGQPWLDAFLAGQPLQIPESQGVASVPTGDPATDSAIASAPPGQYGPMTDLAGWGGRNLPGSTYSGPSLMEALQRFGGRNLPPEQQASALDSIRTAGQGDAPGSAPPAVTAEPPASHQPLPPGAGLMFETPQQPPPQRPAGIPGLGGIAAAQRLEEKGIRGQADAAAQAAREQAEALDAYQRGMKEHQARIAGQVEAVNKEHDAIAQDVANTHIDPRRLWSSKSSGERASAIVGIILGGMGSGLTGGPNAALGLIQRQIDADIDAQKENLQTKKGLLATNLAKTQNIYQAEQLTRVQMAAVMEGQIKLAAARSGSADAMAKADQMIGQSRKQYAGVLMQIAQQQAQQEAIRAAMAGDPRAAMFLPKEVQDQLKDLRERTVVAPDGKAYPMPTREEAAKVRDQVEGYRAVKAGVDDMRAQRKAHGRSWLPFTSESATDEAQRTQMVGALRMAMVGPGAMSDSERKLIEGVVPSPGAIFTSDDAFEAAMRQIEQKAFDGMWSGITGRSGATVPRFRMGGAR